MDWRKLYNPRKSKFRIIKKAIKVIWPTILLRNELAMETTAGSHGTTVV